MHATAKCSSLANWLQLLQASFAGHVAYSHPPQLRSFWLCHGLAFATPRVDDDPDSEPERRHA